MTFTIYPSHAPSNGNCSTMPILIFCVGTALTTVSYASVFEPIEGVIVYVMDTNPFSVAKTLQGFQNQATSILSDIQQHYGVSSLSDQIYLGGHSVGGIIAVNALFPGNFQVSAHSLEIDSLPFPVKGLICFDAVDGDKERSSEYPFRTKYDPTVATQYVTSNGTINPLPVLMFATAVENTGVNPVYGGQRAFNTVASSVNSPSNKYCFVSAGKYHHMDYTDPSTQAYRTDMTRVLWSVKQQSEYVADFQNFIRHKIQSFIFSSTFDRSVIDDLHFHQN